MIEAKRFGQLRRKFTLKIKRMKCIINSKQENLAASNVPLNNNNPGIFVQSFLSRVDPYVSVGKTMFFFNLNNF